jgi:nucleoside-diphosphate-sugar epimerase
MKCFVAGGGGFIGQALCAELLVRGHEVTCYDRFFFNKEPPLGCQKVVRDIRTVSMFDLSGMDAVIDLAGLSNDASGDMDRELTWQINVKGAQALALCAKRIGIKKYLCSSSASVYGTNSKIGLTERDDCKPLTVYAESKVRMEDFLRDIADNDFQPIILRNATVFGVSKRMRFDLVVNGMTLSAWKNRQVHIDGHGWQWRPLVHIDDVAKAFADRLSWGHSCTENIVSHNQMVGDIARQVAKMKRARIVRHEELIDARSYNLEPTIVLGKTTADGVEEVWSALEEEKIDSDDPTCWTVKYYRSLPEFALKEAAA